MKIFIQYIEASSDISVNPPNIADDVLDITDELLFMSDVDADDFDEALAASMVSVQTEREKERTEILKLWMRQNHNDDSN